MTRTILAIDPGISATGWAKVQEDSSGNFSLLSSGTFKRKLISSQMQRIRLQLNQVKFELQKPPRATELYTELYLLYTPRKGSVYNTMLVGAIIHLPESLPRKKILSCGVTPSAWKSWIRKAMVEPNVEKAVKKFSKEVFKKKVTGTAHEIDAIGLGIFALHHKNYSKGFNN